MTQRRTGLGRGLSALIPTTQEEPPTRSGRPADVFFPAMGAPERPKGGSARDLLTPAKTNKGGRPQKKTNKSQNPPVETTRTSPSAETKANVETTSLVPVPGATYGEIPVKDIVANARQPRQEFDEAELAELAASINEIGVLQPIVVRPLAAEQVVALNAHYELVMGERRWRAAQLAGNEAIPAIVRRTEDEDLLRDALLENLHRANLNPLEEAAAYRQLMDDFSCTQEVLATRIMRSRPQIANTLRLLKLPASVQRRVAAGVLTAGHARALLGLDTPAEMEKLAARIVAEGLSVRTTEEIVALGGGGRPKRRAATNQAATTLNSETKGWLSQLGDHLDTEVKVLPGAKRGRIVIDYAGNEDLTRIMRLLLQSQ